MKKYSLYLLLFVLSLISFSCKDKSKDSSSNAIGGEIYISAYTSGMISSRESVVVRFVSKIKYAKKGDKLKKGVLSISPNIAGQAFVTSDHEIEFIPDEHFANGQEYSVALRLNKLLKVPSKYKKFKFQFTTVRQALVIKEGGLKLHSDGKYMTYKANLFSADFIDNKKIEKIINQDKDINIKWEHSLDGRTHSLLIDSLIKTDTKQEIKLKWNASSCGLDESGEILIKIPAKGDFYVDKVLPEMSNNKQFKIIFSDVIDPYQDLRGLIKLANYSNLRFNIVLNEIIIYSDVQLTGERQLLVYDGLKALSGELIKKTVLQSVVFEEIKPLVKFIGKGVITPSKEGFIVPFSAVNLNAVDLRVIKIYNNNIHQFFQNNRFNESGNLKKVGQLVLQKKINLQDGQRDLKKWNDYRLNLAEMMEVDKSAIYRLELRFKKQYSLYDNLETKTDELENEEENVDGEEIEDAEYWYTAGWYSNYYYPEGYSWRDKEDPSTISYFNSNHFKSKNIFASNIGIIAKKGGSNDLLIYVSELVSTDLIANAQVEAYSYQNQLMASATTDKDGFANLKLKNKAFLLVVKKDKERAYLRVDDGSSLSISNFDVAGVKVQKGLKGFIYGERGVWRPGDDLHISFILEDKQGTLPNNHPIIAKLYNARGQFVKKIVQNITDKSINCFTFKTDKEAPTGNWKVEIQVGGARFTKVLKVETIKPNRLKINMSINGDMIKSSSNTRLKIKTAWLHGAKAPNLKTDIKMNLRPIKTNFKGYSNYIFDDKSKDFEFSEKQIFDGKTNESGVLNIGLANNNLSSAPGLLRASFLTRVFEKSGDFSLSGKSFTLSPYSSYVGMQLPTKDSDWYKTKKKYKLDIVTLDEDNKRQDKSVTVELFKVKWSWWWDSNDRNLASYVNRRYNKNVTTYKLKTKAGKASIDISAKEYGRYYLKVTDTKSGHSCGKTLYFSDWGGFDVSDLPGGASMLALSLSKQTYNVGEDITVNIPSSKEGKALVSIESGIAVIERFVIKTTDKNTQFTFKASKAMTPNVYINVSLIQKHQNTDNDHPMRLYGIIPVKVNNPETILKPVIYQSKELRPEKEFSIKIGERNEQEMTYTIAIIDEGLLDITSYKTPNPHSTFYAREALGVKTWDMYDYVLGAYGARLESAFAIGGDAESRMKNKKRTNRFSPVVIFKGPFTLKAGKTNMHKFEMPNYIGAVRTMVIAANKGAYGSTETRSEVKKPLMLLATLPRLLSPGDRIKLPVTLFAMNNKIKDVNLSLTLSDKLQVIGSNEQTVHFTEKGEKIAEFEVLVTDDIGKADIHIVAEGNGERATFDTDIEIRIPNPPVTEISQTFVQKNKENTIDISTIGIKGSNKAVLEVSSLPAMNLSKRLEYLIDYPHGCLEQTVSGAFPQLYLSALTNLTADQEKELMDNVNTAISKLMNFQTLDGALTYWPGSSHISEWSNIYAGHFMLMASKKGYAIPPSMKTKYLRYLNTRANEWNDYSKYYNSELVQAYRLFVLALAGQENVGAMNRMREKSNLHHIAVWRLASAYAVAGRTKVAEDMINNLSYAVKPYREWGNTFGTPTRDKAMVLETLTLLNKKEESFKIASEIATRLGEDRWMSTQTIAYSLYSMSQYIDKYNQGSASVVCDYSLNGKKEAISSTKSIFSKEIDIESLKKASIKVTNKGENPLYVRVINKGVPLKYEISKSSSKLKMSVVYRDTKGHILDVKNLRQATDFVAEISVTNTSYSDNYEQMALTAMFPTGWEIANTRLFEAKDSNKADYSDFRDDRVIFYFSLGNKNSKTFKINLNASYKGNYYLPAISCQAMYDNEVRAIVAGQQVKVQ